MRLISQDGLIDVSYELFELVITDHWDYNKTNNHKLKIVDYQICAKKGGDEYIMGVYLTKEKALEVMKDLREDWKDDLAFFYFPDDKEK